MMKTHYAVQMLQNDYGAVIDDDRLEDWPDFFIENCFYRITTRDDYADNLPLGIIYANSRNMLVDRVTAIRNANIFEDQGYRHIIGSPRILESGNGEINAQTNFVVIRTMQTGDAMLFASGVYADRISETGETLKFIEKTVILDSSKIDTLLAIPL